MVLKFLEKALGLSPERAVNKLKPLVEKIELLSDEMSAKSNDSLRTRILELKAKISQVSDKKELEKELNEALPETFAIVREASWRVLGMKHFPVQLLGGIVLHQNKIAEMKTGEGKTLVATCPAVLNALSGRGVHIVTVNDYLAKRDSEWMGKIYKFLGLSVGLIIPDQSTKEKIDAYNSDILYATNNELGFDFLRDNMAESKSQQVCRKKYFAIIDEVDSVLIDEARTPLIISGAPEANKKEIYIVMNHLADKLSKGKDKDDKEGDYYAEEKNKNIVLTDNGIKKAEKALGVSDLWDVRANLAHHLLQALKAKEFFNKDVEYVVEINQESGKKRIQIVDEFTGRIMHGRRWSDGLHQAIEAKENVEIQEETLTLAGITFQNFFRMYDKLAGMTGTALTEEQEFKNIYNLRVIPIPPNKQNARKDLNDQVYKNQKQKFYAILQEIVEIHRQGRPILVGTTSIDKSEYLSEMLSKPQESVKLLTQRAQRLISFLEANYSQVTDFIKTLKKFADKPVNISYEEIRNFLFNSSQDENLEQKFRANLRDILVSPDTNLNDSSLAMYFKTFLKSSMVVEEIRKGIKHNVLNAKYHEKEAQIISQAGRLGAVTIATNMAGRGTDIILGGNPEVLAHEQIKNLKLEKNTMEYEAKFNESLEKIKPIILEEQKKVIELGGLHIIGSERHESRRIDNQLRGRAGRQGDPGSTRFFLALDDTLMRIFGGEKLTHVMEMLKTDEDIAIEAGLVNKGIESSQKKIEAHNFEIRKRLLEYDDVQNTHRQVIYAERQKILDGCDMKETYLKSNKHSL